MDGFSGERLISDAKGNYHGIQAHKGQDINLVFSFSGTIEGVDVLEDYLNSHTMTVNILNCKHQVVLSKIVTETVIGNVLETIISQTDNDLLPDIYRMQLVIESEDGPVTLFAERDSFIRIVE